MKENKIVEEKIIEVLIRIARKGEGGLVILGGKPRYRTLIKQDIKPFNIVKNPKLFESLCTIDGAVILDKDGKVKNYGAMIESKKVFPNYGTRNSAGLSASTHENVSSVFMASEEERKVKIFKNGRMVMQIDALTKDVEKKINEIADILSSIGVGAIGVIGASSIGFGIALIPGVLVFGGVYWIINKLKKLRQP